MRFSRLRLIGFKSFVEPGEFVIERGLTGVVGPNGCGKSNLVEALRWVMGESSYKNMRASGMDDVIFSGSGTRPARNTAEVTLFLDNSDRTAPSGFNDADELQVSRRIEREAGSVYRINGREARAKDVQLLFADQSTGARSPSMVGQGRIGELIQAKPQERRALLEEAAGISGLHTRRHEAELRLRGAEQNLERLDDVVRELEGQIESLKRQARHAARFKSLSADIRKAEATLLHLRWSAAKAQESEALSALSAATSTVAERAAEQMNAAKDQAVNALRLPELRDAEAAAAAAFQRLTIAKTQIEEEAARIRARHAELGRRVQQLDADMAREEQMVRDNADLLRRLDDEQAALRGDDEGAVAREQATRAAFDKAAAVLGLGEALLARLTAERAEAAAARNQLERSTQEMGQRRDRLGEQAKAVEQEIAGLQARIAALPGPAGKQLDLENAQRKSEAAEIEASRSEKAVADARAGEAAARGPVQGVRAELAKVETEARTLAKFLNGSASSGFASVLDDIGVDRGYETALGAALGDDLQAALDPKAAVHWAGADLRRDDPPMPAGILSLSSVVRAPLQLARRLAQIGIVEGDDAPRLQSSLKPGQKLVSRDGAVWRWDGLTARADAPSASAQRLAQKNRLAELDAEKEAGQEKLSAVESALNAAEATVREKAAAESAARQGWKDAQRAVGEARDALARAERADGEIAARRLALNESQARIAADKAETDAALDRLAQQVQESPDLSDLRRWLEAQSATVARDRGVLADARAAHDGLKREADQRARRLTAIGAEREAWTKRADNAATQIAALVERRVEAAGELDALADAPDELDAKRRALLGQLSQAEELRKRAADRLQEANTRQQAFDRAANAAVQALSASREARIRAEEKLNAAEDRRKEAEARIREVLNTEPQLALRQSGIDAGGALPEAVFIERQLERLRAERERLGAVNLRAEEEQEELTERLETLISDREDVVEAIRKLRQAILSLNKEGRDRLLAAFDVVNAQFQRLFTHLFGGGTAELQLIESDDPLEAGLEILARPPGKKPQTMTLLSGGEQALTAMALIFAVFLTNPAPICVLDEVDAPLDDHNVERFCNLMDEMAATTETRFVIITHNPITMARMNRLFGVTMAEQGVSQLVSVDLGTAEQMREVG